MHITLGRQRQRRVGHRPRTLGGVCLVVLGVAGCSGLGGATAVPNVVDRSTAEIGTRGSSTLSELGEELALAVEPTAAAPEWTALAETSAPGTGEVTSPEETVPPPGGEGDLSPVAMEPLEILPAVDAGETVAAADDLTIELSLSRTTAEGGRPGEIGGDAVAVTVHITNTGELPRDASTVFVTAQDADEAPLAPLSTEPYSPIDGDLKPGLSAEGTYVFSLEEGLRQPFTILVLSAADEPVSAFVGDL